MIEEHAQVCEIDDQQAVIKVQRQSSCNSCSLEQGCGVGSLGRLIGHRALTFSIQNQHNLKKGDHIVIGLPDRAFLKAGFLIYLLPLISLFLFASVSDIIFNAPESVNVLAAVLGLACGLWFSAHWSASRHSNEFQAKFIRKEFI